MFLRRHCKFATKLRGDFMNAKKNIEEDIDLTEEESNIITELIEEAHTRIEAWKKKPTPQKWVAFTITVSQLQGFLAQLLALRGIKTSPYATS